MNLPHIGPKTANSLLKVRNRVTTDTASPVKSQSYAVREEPAGSWRTLEVQRKYLLNLPMERLTTIALDLSPQANKGLWDFLRFCNPGHLFESEGSIKTSLDSFIERLDSLHGSFDALLDRMFASVFVHGAYFMELVLNEAGTRATNIAILDPIRALYRRQFHPDLGQYWELGERGATAAEFVVLQGNPRVIYSPIDTLPDKPYGRPMITPAIYASIFMLGLLQDLRRVVANQGLRRADYTVAAESVLALAAAEGTSLQSDEEIAGFIDAHIDQIQTALEGLEPDQAYVHLDTVEVNIAEGSVSGISFIGLDQLIRTLERNITIGVKSVPILMASNEAISETHANRQLDFYLGSIESMQDEAARILSRFFELALQVEGRRGTFEFAFRKQRVADRKTVAETQRIQIENIVMKKDNGLISEEDAISETKFLANPVQIQ